MSGAHAAVQAVGCCCRPVEGCTCQSPNRPGAVFDRTLTSVSVNAEFLYENAHRRNACPYQGCECPCLMPGTQLPQYGTPGGIEYGYVPAGAIVDPDFVEDTECEPFMCRPRCCSGCQTYRVSANFGSVIAEQDSSAGLITTRWRTVIRNASDHRVSQWNWMPKQVGYCVGDPNLGYPDRRIRRYCPFLKLMDGNVVPGSNIDPNGQFVNPVTGAYTGANIGPLAIHAMARVSSPVYSPNASCDYVLTIGFFEEFQQFTVNYIIESGPIQYTGDMLQYKKPCMSPSDTVLGTYRLVGRPEDYLNDFYSEDQECGPIRDFIDTRWTVPATVEVS